MAQRPQHRRRIDEVHQRHRIARLAMADQPCAGAKPGLDLGLGRVMGADRIAADARCRRDVGQRVERGFGRSVFGHQPVKGLRPDPARADQPQPRQPPGRGERPASSGGPRFVIHLRPPQDGSDLTHFR
jgi:hypothetical protein